MARIIQTKTENTTYRGVEINKQTYKRTSKKKHEPSALKLNAIELNDMTQFQFK